MVIHKGETKIAQYGQWDGYPEGQGVTILNFVRKKKNLEKLRAKLEKVRFKTKKESHQTSRDSYSPGSNWMTNALFRTITSRRNPLFT